MSEPIQTVFHGRLWVWRVLVLVLIVVTPIGLVIGQPGVIFSWLVPLYQWSRMTPELRRKLLFR
jgi:hypothetical protein